MFRRRMTTRTTTIPHTEATLVQRHHYRLVFSNIERSMAAHSIVSAATPSLGATLSIPVSLELVIADYCFEEPQRCST